MIGLVVLLLSMQHVKIPSLLPPAAAAKNSSQAALAPNGVNVSGTVAITGSGEHLTGVVFYSANNATYNAIVTNNKYFVRLPNVQSYSYVVSWSDSYPWQNGWIPVLPTKWFLTVGTINNAPLVHNINITLPDTNITVIGHAYMLAPNVSPTGIVIREPLRLIFDDSYDYRFVANLSPAYVTVYKCVGPNKQVITNSSCTSPSDTWEPFNATEYLYSITLPNWMNYSATIDYNGLYGTKGSCSAGYLNVEEGVGVTSIQKVFDC